MTTQQGAKTSSLNGVISTLTRAYFATTDFLAAKSLCMKP